MVVFLRPASEFQVFPDQCIITLDSLLAYDLFGGIISFSGEFCISSNDSRRHWSASLFMIQFEDEVQTLVIFHYFKLQHLLKDKSGGVVDFSLQIVPHSFTFKYFLTF